MINFDKILQSDPTRNETKPTAESLSTAALGTSRNLISLFETMQNGHPNDVRETMHLPTIGGIYYFIYIYTPPKNTHVPKKRGHFKRKGDCLPSIISSGVSVGFCRNAMFCFVKRRMEKRRISLPTVSTTSLIPFLGSTVAFFALAVLCGNFLSVLSEGFY